MAFLIGGANSAADTGFDVANSCRYNDNDSAYMHNTLSSGDGSDVKGTVSFWTKRGNLGTNQAIISGKKGNTERVTIGFSSDDYFEIQFQDDTNAYNWRSTAVYRDIAAWYNFVIHLDTGNATANSRAKVWLNGVEITEWGTREAVPQSLKIGFFNGTDGNKRLVGARGGSSVDKFYDGYIAEVVVLNNTLDAATNFGEYNEDSPNIWQPIDVSGLTFGTHGFYLDFEASDNLGNDANGGADFTEVNLAAADQASDSPTNNFAVYNILSNSDSGTRTFSEGNLYTAHSGSDSAFCSYSTIGIASGKWYWEVKFAASSGGTDLAVGVGYDFEENNRTGAHIGYSVGSYDYNAFGNKHNDGNESSYGDTYGVGDIIGVALDLDNHKLYFSKNGTFQDSGDPTTGATGTGSAFDLTTGQTYFMGASHASATSRTTDHAGNYGGCPAFAISSGNADANGYGNFEYAPPSGYYALCTKNLAEYG